MRLYLITLFVLMVIGGSTFVSLSATIEEEIIPKEKPPIQKFAERYADYFQRQIIENGIPGGALVIVQDTNVLVMNGYGLKKIRSKDSIDVNTVFRVGSLSKGFASVLTGILTEKGTLSFDDQVIEHLPYFRLKSAAQTGRVTIQHLLSHTTGLPYHAFTNLIERGKTPKEIAAGFKDLELIAKEGEIYAYQNASYALIHNISSKAANTSYEDLLQKLLFTPNNMVNASANYQAINSQDNVALPHSYNSRRHKWKRSKITKKYYNAIPAGGINASISDMGEWLKLLMGNRPEIISENTLDQIFTPLIKTNQKRRYFSRWNFLEEAYYGLGWRVLDCGADTIIYHGGYVNGYRSEIAFNREDKIGICALFNAPTSFAGQCVPNFWEGYFDFRAAQDTAVVDEQPLISMTSKGK